MKVLKRIVTGHGWRPVAGVVLAAACCFAQKDSGPRGGPPGAGGTFNVLDNTNPAADRAYHDFFSQALSRFQEIDSVSGTIDAGNGLGPSFNGNSCAQCHAQPAIGGGSPAPFSPQVPRPNPQVALATLDQAVNVVPSFITADGPIREARFIQNSDGSPDGGVHDLYTVRGRTDAPGCTLQQPDFGHAVATGNVTFRIPISTFGAGLVEMVSDQTLLDNLNATAQQRAMLGIGGTFNRSGNDGTITRFGWKAQNKSLLVFSGEAYNVEQGVSNEVFVNERFLPGTSASDIANCTFNGTPEDGSNAINPQAATIANGIISANGNINTTRGTVSEMSSDVINFAAFMRMLAPPVPTTSSPSELTGQALFSQIGCAMCHAPTLVTERQNGRGIGGGAKSSLPALSGYTFHPYSDYAIHHMGSNLADGVTQGAAGADQFRTAPLWGVGQRLFFLHDGRTSDLLEAILAHADSGNNSGSNGGGNRGFATPFPSTNCGSEADNVIRSFNSLPAAQKQDILNFLRSL